MAELFGVLLVISGIAGFVCSIIVLIEAFKDEVWKGILAILVPIYLLYYTFVDFDHEYRGWVQFGVVLPILVVIAGMIWSPQAATPPVPN